MNSPVSGQGPSPREYLLNLNKLVPKTSEACNKLAHSEKTALVKKITEVLFQVFDNRKSFGKEQQTTLRNIRELVKKAENMQLLSEPAKEILSKLAFETKEKGLSLFTAPRDLKIKTKDGKILEVNSDLLKKNSLAFKAMLDANMKEKKENTLELTKYSTQTIEQLMSYLHAPSEVQINLPNSSVTLELLDLAMTYGLEDLIKKLEPAVTTFISKQPEAILEHAQNWLTFLISQKNGPYASISNKLIVAITPHFLEHYGIPFKTSDIPETFEISSKSLLFFFHEDTKDLLQFLPVVLSIKDKKALARFGNACKLAKGEEPIHIKLLCRQDLSNEEKATLQDLAKASQINILFEKIPAPLGTTLFGKEQWETYFGSIGEAPPLPANIAEILSSPCPYFPEKTWKDTHMLVLIPATVKGQPFNLNYLRELVQNPKSDHPAKYNPAAYQPILDQYGSKAPERSYWTLMSKDVITNSRDKTYQQQKELLKANPHCKVPDLLTAATCILTHFTATGVHLFSKEFTNTRCQETIQDDGVDYQTFVGFDEDGLYYYYAYHDYKDLGVAAAWKFS